MGEHNAASIFFDHGIGEAIDQVAPSQLLKVRIPLKRPRADGLSAEDEFEELIEFEDNLQALVQKHESNYVGRATAHGCRIFYIYTPDPEKEWASALRALGQQHGYELSFDLQSDENHAGYWEELFPTEDDWQVIKDLKVIEALEKHGDDGSASRLVHHWAFFPTDDAAQQFCRWIKEHGYFVDGDDATDDGRISVQFSHEGSVRLQDLTSHTVALRRKAEELEGEYDGWEVPVCES